MFANGYRHILNAYILMQVSLGDHRMGEAKILKGKKLYVWEASFL